MTISDIIKFEDFNESYGWLYLNLNGESILAFYAIRDDQRFFKTYGDHAFWSYMSGVNIKYPIIGVDLI